MADSKESEVKTPHPLRADAREFVPSRQQTLKGTRVQLPARGQPAPPNKSSNVQVQISEDHSNVGEPGAPPLTQAQIQARTQAQIEEHEELERKRQEEIKRQEEEARPRAQAKEGEKKIEKSGQDIKEKFKYFTWGRTITFVMFLLLIIVSGVSWSMVPYFTDQLKNNPDLKEKEGMIELFRWFNIAFFILSIFGLLFAIYFMFKPITFVEDTSKLYTSFVWISHVILLIDSAWALSIYNYIDSKGVDIKGDHPNWYGTFLIFTIFAAVVLFVKICIFLYGVLGKDKSKKTSTQLTETDSGDIERSEIEALLAEQQEEEARARADRARKKAMTKKALRDIEMEETAEKISGRTRTKSSTSGKSWGSESEPQSDYRQRQLREAQQRVDQLRRQIV